MPVHPGEVKMAERSQLLVSSRRFVQRATIWTPFRPRFRQRRSATGRQAVLPMETPTIRYAFANSMPPSILPWLSVNERERESMWEKSDASIACHHRGYFLAAGCGSLTGRLVTAGAWGGGMTGSVSGALVFMRRAF